MENHERIVIPLRELSVLPHAACRAADVAAPDARVDAADIAAAYYGKTNNELDAKRT